MLLTFLLPPDARPDRKRGICISRSRLYTALQRGKSVIYAKHDRELEEYLIQSGIDDLKFVPHHGHASTGADLADMVREARQLQISIEALDRKVGNAQVVEQAAIAGLMNAHAIGR